MQQLELRTILVRTMSAKKTITINSATESLAIRWSWQM